MSKVLILCITQQVVSDVNGTGVSYLSYNSPGSITSQCISIGHITLNKGAVACSKLSIQLCFAVFTAGLVQVDHGHLVDETLLVSWTFYIHPQTHTCSIGPS